VAFKEGSFYVIQGTTDGNKTVYCQADSMSRNQAKLRAIARKSKYSYQNAYLEEDEIQSGSLMIHMNPFDATVWPITHDFFEIVDQMREVRKICGREGVDPMSLKIVVIQTTVSPFVPESPSEQETELRRFALEKLSAEERTWLNVNHYAVYGKLAGRPPKPDDDQDVPF
jgi:hypothetical protein